MNLHANLSPIQPVVYAQGLDVTTISCSTASALPAGLQVRKLDSSGGTLSSHSFTGSGWEDDSTGLPVTSTAINGLVSFYNPSGHDIGITW
jgi:hypothetical protein